MEGSVTFKRDPILILADIEKALKPQRADMLYVGGLQVSRIRERTARGVDYTGQPFTPYKNSGPVYWYPSVHTKNRVASRNRFFKLIISGSATKTSVGVKFSSYEAMKASVSGASTVNLMGLKAPHMLMAIQIKVNGYLMTIGIFGDEAIRAEAHNSGTKYLPKREFFNASESDKALMTSDLVDFGAARANQP